METATKYLLQSNLLRNHIEASLIIVASSTDVQDPENNFPRESKP